MTSISTHRMLRNGGRNNLAILAQTNSLAPYVKNFWAGENSSSAPVFITAFYNGATAAISAGDTITGGTSGNSGTVVAIEVTSGSWGGGNAGGWFTWTYSNPANQFTNFEQLTSSSTGVMNLVNGTNLSLFDISAHAAHFEALSTDYASSPTNGIRTTVNSVTQTVNTNGTVWSPNANTCALIATLSAPSDLTRSNIAIGRYGTTDEKAIYLSASEAKLNEGSASQEIITAVDSSFSPVVGTTYTVAAVIDRNTGKFEHWVDGVKKASQDLTSTFASISLSDYMRLNSVGGVATSQDFYGAVWCGFEDGIPSDFATYMTEFGSAVTSSATKVLPARYVSLT